MDREEAAAFELFLEDAAAARVPLPANPAIQDAFNRYRNTLVQPLGAAPRQGENDESTLDGFVYVHSRGSKRRWNEMAHPAYQNFSNYYQPITGPWARTFDIPVIPPVHPDLTADLEAHKYTWRIHNPLRVREVLELKLRGDVGTLYPAAPREPIWMFGGIVRSWRSSWGPAWDCFYYPLSDLWENIPRVSTLVGAFADILRNIHDIGQFTADPPIMVHFEGQTDHTSEDRLFIACTSRTYTLGTLMNDPLPIFNCVAAALQSEAFADFAFLRVYVHVLRRRGGGTLTNMPESYKKIRDSASYSGLKKGYKAIPDSSDNSCGLEALIWGLAAVMLRIRKRCKSLHVAMPEGTGAFQHYRARTNSAPMKQLRSELMLELGTSAEWKQGTDITHVQLITAFRLFVAKRKLDIGLVIFDAIVPARKPSISYDISPEAKIPIDFICLVHWTYPGGNASGHYDVIDQPYVTTWILHNKKKGNNKVKYDFRSLTISYGRTDETGQRCDFCSLWIDAKDAKRYDSKHGGSIAKNTIHCAECGVNFKSRVCFKEHKTIQHGHSKARCQNHKACSKCGGSHTNKFDCTKWYCKLCGTSYVKHTKHVCYISHLPKKSYEEGNTIIYADLESDRDSLTTCQRALLCVAMVKEPCEEHVSMRFPPRDCKICHTIVKNFNGYDCIQHLLEWLEEGYMDSTIVCHNGGKYDFQLICETVAVCNGNLYIAKSIPRGTKIIYLELHDRRSSCRGKKIRFIDSLNFILFSLSEFGNAFGLEQGKGIFPYEILNKEDWKDTKTIPGPEFFSVTKLELECIDNLKQINPYRWKQIMAILDHIKEYEGKEWDVEKKLIEYCQNDVKVLMDGCNTFRENFYNLVGIDPFKWVTLASAVAASYRQPEYMPSGSCQLFPNETRMWQQRAIRGGRTEPFMLYFESAHPGQYIKWVDIRSEYPFAMATKYFPIGEVSYEKKYDDFIGFAFAARDFFMATGKSLYSILLTPDGSAGMGIIECTISSQKCNFPILPSRGCPPGGKESKLLFMVRHGEWCGFTTLLGLALKHNQVIIVGIKRIQLWLNTSDKLFKKWMCKLYAAKAMAGGWDKILGPNGEERKEQILLDNKEMGVVIIPEEVKANKGMETTAKTMANCGWGYMCQTPKSTTDDFYDNMDEGAVENMGNFLSTLGTHTTNRRLVGMPIKVGDYTKIRSTIDPINIPEGELNKKVCYQVAGQVPAYGQAILSEGILSLHPDQVVYCDTDSIGFIVDDKRKDFKDFKTGVLLGDWVDEYPKQRITGYYSLGPKSYFLRIEGPREGEVQYKGKFKGIPIYSKMYSMLDKDGKIAKLGLEEMKTFLEDSLFGDHDMDAEESPYQVLTLTYTNHFKRTSDYQIKTVQEKKTVRMTFDKRRVIIPKDAKCLKDCGTIRTLPWDDCKAILTQEDVTRWHDTHRAMSFIIPKNVISKYIFNSYPKIDKERNKVDSYSFNRDSSWI